MPWINNDLTTNSDFMDFLFVFLEETHASYSLADHWPTSSTVSYKAMKIAVRLAPQVVRNIVYSQDVNLTRKKIKTGIVVLAILTSVFPDGSVPSFHLAAFL